MAECKYTPEQKEEALLCVRDELKCLTARWVSRNFGISRDAAACLLEDVVQSGTAETVFEVTRMRVMMQSPEAIDNEENKENAGITRKKVSLVKETIDPSTYDFTTSKNKGQIYSIALSSKSASTVQTAHEEDMSNLRDAMQQSNDIFDTTILTSSVQPAKHITMERTDSDSLRQKRMLSVQNNSNSNGKNHHNTNRPLTSSSSSSSNIKKSTSITAPPRKVTTAASFFGAAATKATKSKTTKTTSNTTKSKPIAKKAATNKTTSTKQKSKKERDDEDMADFIVDDDDKEEIEIEDDNDQMDDAGLDDEDTQRKSKRLQSSKKKKTPSPKYGNADDFVGDEDEDEDDLMDDVERRKRLALANSATAMEIRKRAVDSVNKNKKKRMIVDDDDMNDDADDKQVSRESLAQQKRVKRENTTRPKKSNSNKTNQKSQNNGNDDDDEDMEYDDCNENHDKKMTVHGRMDSFAQKMKPKEVHDSATSRKRQRKKLIEKTSMDEKGYIHTETVTVWENVSSDEEVEVKEVQKSNPSVKNAMSSSSTVGGAQTAKKQKALGGSTMSSKNTTDGNAAKKKNTKSMKQTGLMGFFTKK